MTATVLIVRRVRDLAIRQCARCGEDVALFPAGHAAVAANPSMQLVCSDCHPPDEGDTALSYYPSVRKWAQ